MKKNTFGSFFGALWVVVGICSASVSASPVRGKGAQARPATKLPTEKKKPATTEPVFVKEAPPPPRERPANTYSRPSRVAEEPIESDSEAQPYAEERSYENLEAPRKMNPYWIFLGADVGLSSFGKFNDSATESSRSGIHLGVRALLARYWSKFVLDGGLGWHFFQNSGTYPSGDKVKVTTRGAYIDLSGRYRFPRSNWQLGPEIEYWLSTDNGLNPSVFDNTSNTSLWAGLQGVYEYPSDDNRIRFGGRWLTDINVTGRSAHIFQVFFQFGFSIFGSGKAEPTRKYEQINEGDLEKATAYTPPADPLPIATPEPTPDATPWQEPIAISTPEPPVAKEKLVVTLDVNDLPFEFDSARMPKYAMDRVREIGRFLGENKKSWKGLTVSGHTDERGSDVYNNRLSKARADTVRQLLGEGGAPVSRIKSIGWGERKPKAKGHNESAWAQNRRVELEFQGVKDVQIINSAFGSGSSVPKGQETR